MQMLTGKAIHLIDCPLSAIVFWLEAIWFLARVKSSMLLLGLVLKLSIEPWN